MKRFLLIFVSILMLFTFLACFKNVVKVSDTVNDADKTNEYRRISPQEAKAMIDHDKNVIILDVRTEDEYNSGHIPGSILIPDYQLRAEARKMLPNQDAVILVYCRSGRRSERAAKELIQMDYRNVYDLGGIVGWNYGIVK